MRQRLIFIISGPSGSGKTTLAKRLLRRKLGLIKSISYTTRPPRRGEKRAKDYYYLSQEKFLKLRQRGEFLESQEVYGYLYATPKRFFYKSLKKADILLCIDTKGAKILKKLFPQNTVRIFILPPSLRVLKKRLSSRFSKHSKDSLLRLKSLKEELQAAEGFDFVVVNRDLCSATKALEAIVISERLKRKDVLHTFRKTLT